MCANCKKSGVTGMLYQDAYWSHGLTADFAPLGGSQGFLAGLQHRKSVGVGEGFTEVFSAVSTKCGVSGGCFRRGHAASFGVTGYFPFQGWDMGYLVGSIGFVAISVPQQTPQASMMRLKEASGLHATTPTLPQQYDLVHTMNCAVNC